MIAALSLAAALLGQTVVQAPVDDPLLPQGPLLAMGETREGRFYVDAASWERSDIPSLVRGTAVIVTRDGEPVQVVRLWIDCFEHEYQIGTGRRYDASGRETARTAWVRDQPILPDTAPARIEAAFCSTPVALEGLPTVAGWRAALPATGSAP